MFYPLKFKPIYKHKIWGGDTLKTHYGRDIPGNDVGESWDVACHENGVSVVANGELKGKTLLELFDEYKQELIGSGYEKHAKFPLLYKFIDANDNLSVQVHPNDDYAMKHENGELGKTEMWMIIAAKEGAELVVGVKEGVSKDDFAKAVEEGNIGACLNPMPVEAGDVINIPAGLLHAIGEGILLVEVQQNSDTTYRVYDWDRVDENGKSRDLHIAKSIEVINFDSEKEPEKVRGIKMEFEDYQVVRYIANDYCAVDKIVLNGHLKHSTNDKFHVFNVVEGSMKIKYRDMVVEMEAGESVLLPAVLGEYDMEGKGIILSSYIPCMYEDIYTELAREGHTVEEINKCMSIG